MSPIFTRPRSLYTPDRFLTREACFELLERIIRLSTGGGDVNLYIRSRWGGNLRWARNNIISAGDITDHDITITRSKEGGQGSIQVNRMDDESLRSAVEEAERRMNFAGTAEWWYPLRTAETYADTQLWSDATYELNAQMRADLQRQLVEPAAKEDLLSAGYLEVTASGNGVVNSAGLFAYVPETRAEYSVTVRNKTGTGSGWAGMDNLDWRKIDPNKISSVAMDKCKRSADPVAVEPGRYTVILEPQAVSDLMIFLVRSLDRRPAEMGMGPWAERNTDQGGGGIVVGNQSFMDGMEGGQGGGGGGATGNSRIGQRVLDARINISADPTDPEAPYLPFYYDSTPNRAVTWIKDGILKELAYDRYYANQMLNKPDPLNNMTAFRMTGGKTTIEEMIASTEQGFLVTRFTNVRMVHYDSLLLTGTTSDGLWLIERGKITGPAKNFRFRESPLFAFNLLESLGEPVRVLQRMPAIVPPAKVRDFSFVSLADAV